ncbi:MAG: F0F1 ATP synthase subunit epsilon [Planctomycetota bacterium]|jgi:F-type H+-transporting ATPase subunit epsilon
MADRARPSLKLHVFTPHGTVAEGFVTSVRARDATGSFGICPGHEPLVTALEPSVLSYRTEGAEHHLAVDGGLLAHDGRTVRVATREAVASENLDELAERIRQGFAERRGTERAVRRSLTKLELAVVRTLSQVLERQSSRREQGRRI